MRVHELAKELGLSSKDLLAQLKDRGVEVKSHMSALEDDQVVSIRKLLAVPGASKEATSAPPPKKEKTPEEGKPPQKVKEDSKDPAPAPQTVTAPAPAPEPDPPVVTTQAKPSDTPPPTEPPPSPGPDESKVITLRGPIIVRDFAEQLGMRPNQLVAELMSINVFASISQRIELKVAQRIADKHGFKLEHEKRSAEHKSAVRPVQQVPVEPDEDKPEDLESRPPVVTFLGHVDHGKTSLLDHIRKSQVAAGEDGGITQHIGAYTVDFKDHKITFIDTPGHEAFTAMRARGANMTDIAVIVIASDAGIMPQTREAIQHAQAANVCIMIAVNKIDLRTANPDQVKMQLQETGLAPEEWGGDIICCPVSAVTGEGIDHLLEMILLQSEVLELKANAKRSAQGFVLEAKLEPGMGPTATLLVKRGTLKVGDAMVCGPLWGRIKALMNDQGKKVRTAGPSNAVKCMGLTNVPEAGAEFTIYPNDRAAKAVADERAQKQRLQSLGAPARKVSLDDLLQQTKTSSAKDLPIVLKADVQGSLEAIQQSLGDIQSDKVTINIILAGVGNVTENDVLLASASNAIVVAFRVGKEGKASSMAKSEGVEIRLYSVIYEIIDDLKRAMTGLLPPEIKENTLGQAEVRQVFELSKKRRVAGCMVTKGRAISNSKARLLRDGELIYQGRIMTLKRYQSDASEVRDGQECGIRLDDFSDYSEGDVIEFYEVTEVAQEL